jgi:pyruvate dehydrogenase E2 component (dihydrolipoamide acetyltransferase)
LDLNEHNDADQNEAKAVQDEADAKAQDEQTAQLAADQEAVAATPQDAPPSTDVQVEATEAARRLAEEHGVDLATVEPTGASGQVIAPDVAAAAGEGA